MRASKLLITGILSLFIFVAFAQPGGGGPSTPTPIDGGIGLLVAAAAIYGGKKAFDLRKKD